MVRSRAKAAAYCFRRRVSSLANVAWRPVEERDQVLNHQFLRVACVHGQTLRLTYPGALYHVTARQCPPGYLSRRSGPADVALGPGRRRKALPLACHASWLMANHYHSAISKISRNRSARQREKRYFKARPPPLKSVLLPLVARSMVAGRSWETTH